MDNTPTGNKPVFFGQKVSIPGVNVNSAGDNELILKDDYSTRTYYGSEGAVLQLGKVPNTDNGYGLQLIDTNGNVVARYGKQTDGTVNLKFFDTSGIGVAQFGRFPDGSTALKVAKSGIEVSTADDTQLIFNSGQDVFKIIDRNTYTIPSFTIGTGGSRLSQVIIPHGLSFTPIVDVYVSGNIVNGSLAVIASSYIRLPIFISSGAIQYYFKANSGSYYPLTIIYAVDATNIYIQAFDGGAAFSTDTILAIPVTYFILQETAN